MFLFPPKRQEFNKMFSDNPASFTWTSHDDLGNFKLQFIFSAGKANAESYTLSTGPTYSLLLNVDISSHSEHKQLV